uniref:Cytochrome P450 n=1 Tax=Timema douglasi TaxID=61478 RepID=A0A7R8Z347_TIMDO|nr:unnamed protein product [Timema douglasi]
MRHRNPTVLVVGRAMFSLIVTVCICGVMAWAAYLYCKIHKMKELSEKIPGPPTIPLLGNARDIGATKLSSTSHVAASSKASTLRWTRLLKTGDRDSILVRLWLGADLFVVLSDPKYVEVILGSNKWIDKGVNYRYLYDWLGTGLLTSTDSCQPPILLINVAWSYVHDGHSDFHCHHACCGASNIQFSQFKNIPDGGTGNDLGQVKSLFVVGRASKTSEALTSVSFQSKLVNPRERMS